MSTSDVRYSFRETGTELIERGKDQTIRAYPYRGGNTVTATPGTVSVYDQGGTAIVSAEAFTVTADVCEYTISAALTASLELSEGWRVEWSAVMPDGTTRLHRVDAQLVRTRLHPPVAHADLYRKIKALDPSGDNPLTARADFTDELDEAWIEIEDRLVSNGRRPWLVMSPSSFRRAALALWLANIFDNLATTLNPAHSAQADKWRARYEAAWDSMTFQYDADDDGQADGASTPEREGTSVPGVWLTSRA